MGGMSFNAMRVGWKYKLMNHGELFEFEVIAPLEGENLLLKDVNTLEKYELYDLVKFGRGNDFEVWEIG